MPAGTERRVDADGASPGMSFDELYQSQWWPMLRLATGLVDRTTVAEDVVQDAFTAVYRRWDGIADKGAAVGYLRTSVVNESRSALRKRIRARKYLRVVGEETAEPADHTSVLSAEHEMVHAALADLPDRQREVLTLRYIAELADPDIAHATGLSVGGVRSASSRGLAALRTVLEGQCERHRLRGPPRPGPQHQRRRAARCRASRAAVPAARRPRRQARARPAWNRTLLAAACVIAVIAGAIALVHGSSRDGNGKERPARPTPTPTTATSPPAPTTHTVTVGGARLVLPISWNATRLPDVSPPTWCLAQKGSGTSQADCATTFRRIERIDNSYPVDVNSNGGGGGDPAQYCAPQSAKWSVRYDTRSLGGRSAQWRAFTITCPDGTTRRHEQYVVDTLPAYALRTDQAYGNNAEVVERIAAQSALPRQTAPLALADHGVVRKVTRTSTGARVRLQRTVQPEPGSATVAPAPGAAALPTVTYDIPQAVYGPVRTTLVVGSSVGVFTNGTRVVSVDGT